MKIELKKIAFYERMSEETNAFTADVYVNGVKTGYAKNDGQGGSTFIHSYEGKSLLLHEAESYVEALPPIQVTFANHTHPIKMTLDLFVDNLLEEHLNKKESEKFQKKIKKACLTNIVWGIENGSSFRSMGWKNITIEQILKKQYGIAAIKNAIARVKGELKEGEKILNKNIPIELLS
jgi:hypothetical protein